ncbi:MAG: SIMPL domain-containing protein [Colwellia sp.]|nr:SIMPL domain-containing protein [Colwellia sp.]
MDYNLTILTSEVRIKVFSIIFILIINSFHISSVKADDGLTGIEVMGKASVSAMPDQFLVTLTVKERGFSASKTKALVDRNSQMIVDAASSFGIDKKLIQSTQLSIRVNYDKPSINFQGVDVKTAFNDNLKTKIRTNIKNKYNNHSSIDVSRKIIIPINDLSIYDRLLDKVVKIGVTEISPVQMSIKGSEELYMQALDKAIIDAKQKAQRIANQAGVKLGPLKYLKETSYGGHRRYSFASEALPSSFSSSAGQRAVSAQVIATFSLQQ